MPSWNDLVDHFDSLPEQDRHTWLVHELQQKLVEISHLRGNKNVVFYSSAFLQKQQAPASSVQITNEDLNGFMSVIYGMNYADGLCLLLHTPGGVTNAAETIVSYLRSKFPDIEVVVPTFAMSAGTMISLASNRIVMGRQSQLGPIDPQFLMNGGAISARAIVDQFTRARDEILANPMSAHAWAPVLGSIGPALLQEASNALEYAESMVRRWLESYMLAGNAGASAAAATHFNDASVHKSHGRRIDRTEARAQGLIIEDLENSQPLQEAVLTAYHLCTIIFEKTIATKVLFAQTGRTWLKNWGG